MNKTYEVKVAPKEKGHLFYDRGSKAAFTFDGEQNKVLKLIRGCTYIFNVDAPTHPLYFTTSSVGGSKYRNESLMGKNEKPTDRGTISFYVRDDLPSSFYYQCWNHPMMGGEIIIIEPTDVINCFM